MNSLTVRPAGRFAVRIPLLITALIVSLSSGPVAHAWLTNDVYDKVTQAINRINVTNGNASNAFTRAREAAVSTEGLRDVIDRIGDVYGQVDGPAKDLIDSYVLMLIDLIEYQQQGFEAFMTPDPDTGRTPAAVFREDINALLNELEAAANELMAIDDRISLNLDITVISDLVEILPDIMLYPLQVAVSQGINVLDSKFSDFLAQVVDDLKTAREALASQFPSAEDAEFGPYAQTPMATPSALTNDQINRTAIALQTGGNIVKVTGNILTALGELTDEKEVKIGVHGYVGLHVKVAVLKMIAGIMSTLGEGVATVGARLETYAGNLEGQEKHDEIVGKLDQIIAAMQASAPDTFHSSTSVPLAAYPLASDERQIRVDSGERISLSAGVVTSPNASYQWLKDGEVIPGAVLENYTIGQTMAGDAGQYSVMVTDDSGSTTSAAASLSLIPGRVMNMSVRFDIPDNGTLIAGFVLEEEKAVVVRGIGQSLAEFGIPIESTMQDPTIAIYDADGTVVASNDDYVGDVESDSAMADVGAFPIVSPKDAAIYTLLPSGAYTVHIAGNQLKGGDCIVEVYDADNI